jgi:hypothetical protein
MPALSQNLTFTVQNNSTVDVTYPNTATDVMSYYSDKVQGDGYFGGSDGMHTVMYISSHDFVGSISMQASLAATPTETDWFDVNDTTVTYTEFNSRSSISLDYRNFTGNFVWVRGLISISAGSVLSIQYNH